MDVVAKTKYIRVSPKKVNRVLALIRKNKAVHSINMLKLLPQPTAKQVLKTLQSAVANAINNNKYELNTLVVSKAVVEESIRMKRFLTKSRGRAGKMIKRTSSIMIAVKPEEVK